MHGIGGAQSVRTRAQRGVRHAGPHRLRECDCLAIHHAREIAGAFAGTGGSLQLEQRLPNAADVVRAAHCKQRIAAGRYVLRVGIRGSAGIVRVQLNHRRIRGEGGAVGVGAARQGDRLAPVHQGGRRMLRVVIVHVGQREHRAPQFGR